VKKKKKFKDVNASLGKLLDQPLHLQPLAFEWVYEKVYGADISTRLSEYPFFIVNMKGMFSQVYQSIINI
jgi:hypothetical protein